jgi:UDP-N-acetylglucosamine 2-epimerase (non-hydrolysing)
VKRIAVIVGTRPEAIKLAPVVHALSRSGGLRPMVVSTAQHGQMAAQILRTFGISVEHDLRVMRKGQSLTELSSRLLARLGAFFDNARVDAAVVQGDTSTAFFGGLSAYYRQIPVGHVEAGLRTGQAYSPFPEEIHRKLLADVAAWHFAPTPEAERRLRRENVPARRIFVTGNTVIDALRRVAGHGNKHFLSKLLGANHGKRILLATCHRRENLPHLGGIAKALAAIASSHPECVVLFPLHPNPAIRAIVDPALAKCGNVVLCRPLAYERFVSCLMAASVVLSDSGGVQEEATALGKPVLVLRDHTERPEGVKSGALKLIGTCPTRIIGEADRLLRDRKAYGRMARTSNVFGDGHAAERIVRILERELR